MWCSLTQVVSVDEDQISKIDRFLAEEVPVFPAQDTDAEREAGVKRWQMEVDSSERSDTEVQSIDHGKWLRQSLIGASNTLDVIAIANVRRIVVLERSSRNTQQYDISTTINVMKNMSENDFIHSILVLPVASTRKTEVSASDWTCIIVGLSNGFVNFYTERGVLIFYEKVSDYGITSIRFGHSALTGNQELAFLSRSKLAIVEGHSLFTTLRLAKGQIARGDKSVDEVSTTLELNSKMLRLSSLSRISDFQITGLKKPSTFEQYSTASVSERGVEAQIRPGLPTYSTYFCIAEDIFGAFVWHNFFEQQVNISDYVNKVAANLTSYVPSIGFRSFLGIGTSKKDQPTKVNVKDSRTETAYVRQLFRDPGRVGDRLFVAPRPWNILAVADRSARVLIIDTETRRIVRIFKGYRNARCAFVESPGNIKETKKQVKALFLVIFAPKRGLLEVWTMQNGPRVSAFNVDTRGRLISLPSGTDGLLGTPPDEETIFRQTTASAIFMNSDGQFFSIVAPFRLAALGSSEAAIHDENLFKEFRFENVIVNNDLDVEKFVSFVQTLRTMSYRRKCIELAIRSSKIQPKTVSKSIETLIGHYGNLATDSSKSVSSDSHNFLIFLQLLDRILKFYLLLKRLHPEKLVEKSEECTDALKLTELEVEELHLDLLQNSKKRLLQIPKFPSMKTFVDQFDLNSFSSTPLTAIQVIGGVVNFTPKNDEGKLAVISAIFTPFIFGEIDAIEIIEEIIPFSGLEIETAIELLVTFWLSDLNAKPISFVSRLVEVLKVFQKCLGKTLLQSLENQIRESENVQAGLFFLLSIRALSRWEASNRGVPSGVESGVDAFDVDDQWEQMDEYFEYCELLSRNLSVLSLLDLLPESPGVSLNQLAEKGHGYYREQIGSWIAISMPNQEKFISVVNGTGIEEKGFEIIQVLRRKIPLSLKSDLVLGDCSWECASAWFKDETRRVTKLSVATKFLQNLDKCPRLQHGLGLMLWDTFVRQPFERLYRFVNAHDGRQPRDREARREVLVSDGDLYEFISSVERILRALIYAVVDLEQQPKMIHNYDEIIERYMDYVNLRRSTKPKFVFDGIGHRAFFEPFHSHPLIPLARVEETIKKRRQKFLEECVQNVGSNADADQQQQWQLVLELAAEWQLDVDSLRIKEIVMYYESGMDSEAERVTSIVQDRKQLAFELFPIIVNRIRFFEDGDFYQTISRKSLASLSTIDYIKSFGDNDIPNFEVNPELTKRIIRLINGLLFQVPANEVTAKLKVLRDLESVNEYLITKCKK
ncbi:hypothetical protein FO519_004135 [Halicephalobus sp. NKZ332]|nr:hypothetical protein FO519_004135 [Halicephalobus sp. NKZ332]